MTFQPGRRCRTIVAACCFFMGGLPAITLPQTTNLRVGTNSPASTESVLLALAKDAGILKQNGLDVEVIFITGATTAMQALLGTE